MGIQLEELNRIFTSKGSASRNAKFIDGIKMVFDKYRINTPNRMAGFLSQVGVESEELLYTKELGNSAYFNKYDISFNKEKALSLGNKSPGDGARYKGRGLIQVTGYNNYLACGKALGLDLVKSPELLEEPYYAVMSAGWFWDARNINKASDEDDIKKITKLVNGGYNHLDRRVRYYDLAKKILTQKGA